MTDQHNNSVESELREQEATENGLTRFFETLAPPAGAQARLLSKLDNSFHESQLTLDDVTTDLLAAGLETESEDRPIDEDDLDDEE